MGHLIYTQLDCKATNCLTSQTLEGEACPGIPMNIVVSIHGFNTCSHKGCFLRHPL